SRHVLDRKTELVVKYRPFMHREITVIEGTPRADVIAFFRRNPVFFAKKNFTFSAKGVERFDITGQCDLEHVYDEIVLAGFDLVEQPIIQHHEMARLYAKSVNTLRVVTVFMDDKMDIVYAALKTGNGSAVDNMNAGGLSAAIDVASGVVYTDAIIKGGGACSAHPISGVVYLGFKIPMWDEVQKLLEQVVRVTPGLRFVGWDVAITEDGPILVEGNYIPGYDLLQLPDMTGKKWIIDKYVK
ncbi:MAG: sugar-transfer associated ATP-grasp domain-containing protein, partial [Clostridia bacterium]